MAVADSSASTGEAATPDDSIPEMGQASPSPKNKFYEVLCMNIGFCRGIFGRGSHLTITAQKMVYTLALNTLDDSP